MWEKVKHFKREEFKKDPDKVIPSLVFLMDEIREASGFPIIIHVAWDDSGHTPKSLHYKGMAVDFHWKADLNKFSYLEQFCLLSQFRKIGAIGFYPFWNNPGWHIDIRSNLVRTVWYRDENGVYRYGINNLTRVLVKTLRRML